jgi:tetratricopeptide (TPR) repeat protein
MASKHELPLAEKINYKKLCQAYDAREYKKGITIADSVLAKAPLCSEVVAMKGMCLYQNEKLEGDDGAFALIKSGIKDNFTSAALWHALGVCYRGERDDQQAYACFKKAWKFDGDRSTHAINRDITAMAIQMRDWATYSEVRQKALHQKSNVRYNWITYAVSQHMLGNVRLAAGIMDVMGQVMDWGDGAIEATEVHLYRAQLAILCNQPKDAIAILTKENIVDETGKLQLLAKAHGMHTSKSSKKDAEKVYLELFALGLNERDVLYDIAALREIEVDPLPTRLPGVTPKPPRESAAFVELLDEISAKFPKVDAPRRLALDYCPLPQLARRVEDYCRPLIAKMVPSLTSVLKTLYASAARVTIVEEVFTRWEAELEAGAGVEFAACAPNCSLPNRPNPLWLVCVLQFLSSHYLRKGDFAKAHAYVDRAITHTPTIEMLHLQRAKIYYRQGKVIDAAHHADIARKLDLQDRYVNGKAAKYWLRAGDIEVADRVIALFLKTSPVDETYLNMYEMQNAWYEIELGDAYMLRDDPLNALKAYRMVAKHYQDNHDELLEYHAYTLRRCNIRAFVDIIENDDANAKQRFYLKMAPKIVKAYLKVQEEGEDAVRQKCVARPDISEDPALVDVEDRKRIKKMIKDHEMNVELSDVLGACTPFLAALQTHQPTCPQTHTLAFEVALRRCKPLLAAAAIHKLRELGEAEEARLCEERLQKWVSVNKVDQAVSAAMKA